ncbi:hypothetical protein K4F52_009647 [Lecanicillium sp. MT-2017a]|nr:hypothetical protein K4F52_009647 [Lecanicillium sp. MT-2017a]
MPTHTRKGKKPVAARPESGSPEDGEIIFFFMPNAKYGEFCQWYPAQFAVSKANIRNVVENHDTALLPEDSEYVQFGCAEQFMMYCKAARFGDTDSQRKVLATDSPKEQKRLGKLTAGFTDDSWDKVKSEVVELGNMAKFGQNAALGRKLLATGEKRLCEAASKDRVWGIGFAAHRALPMRRFWGENRLGKALMAVRERLRQVEEEANPYRSEDIGEDADAAE